MKEENFDFEEWPEELDALVASPQHHRLLLENEFVRVLETLILPGEITNLHTHKWPSSLYIISWSDFIRYDINKNIVMDSRKLTELPSPSTALWSDPLRPHRLENIGENLIHMISVEIKK
jgi:hypothetical protein